MHARISPPAVSALAALTRLAPPVPLQTLLRTAGYKLRPPSPRPHLPAVTRRRDEALVRGLAGPHQLSAVLSEKRGGPRPTIVLGGFVPDSTEQVFLLRGFLLRQGSVYYLNYPRRGFSLDLLCAQLDDLVEELSARCGRPPVVLSVSFGGGVALEWLKRRKAAGRPSDLAGLLFVSPVACVEDLVAREGPKPATLMGRAIQPYLNSASGDDPALVEKSRAMMSRMFEAGAHNHAALQTLMSADELRDLHAGVRAAIQGIDLTGARERVDALRRLEPLSRPERGAFTPLSDTPTLILYAEKEASVISPRSPTRAALEGRHRDHFPRSQCRIVTGGESPVQHASLIFHYFQFLPPIAKFYRELKPGALRLAA